MYKLSKNIRGIVSIVNFETTGLILSIPLTDPANTDYQQFKKDIMAGGELQDADGVVMTDAQEFVKGLP